MGDIKKYQGVSDATRADNLKIREEITPRGLQVYYLSQLTSIQGETKDGEKIHVSTEQPYFFLTPDDRNMIFQMCPPVQGIISSRAQRIAGGKLKITPKKHKMDMICDNLRMQKQIFFEYNRSSDIRYKIASHLIWKEIKKTLFDIFPDLSNFDQSLLRWKKRLDMAKINRTQEILDWLKEPSQGMKWIDFIKQWVIDLHIHGSFAYYKEIMDGKVENIYGLPGGTVIPVKTEFVSAFNAYVQIVSGYQPQIYFSDEISYSHYLPVTHRAYGIVPLEALINKVTEYLLFDKRMADQADGTKPPEKAILVTQQSAFGDIAKDLKMPIDPDEQARIQEEVNQPILNGVKVISGENITVVDLSRENLMALMTERQESIKKEMAVIFNMSNMEINMSGGDDTSGRSTSEAQGDIEQQKGTTPVKRIIEESLNQDLIPFRFGDDYDVAFGSEQTEAEQYQFLTIKKQFHPINEIRMNDLNISPLEPDQNNPYNNIPGNEKPDGSENSPLNFKQI